MNANWPRGIISGLVVAGLTLAVVAYFQGKKTHATETLQLALLGMLLNGLFLLLYVAAFIYWFTLRSGG